MFDFWSMPWKLIKADGKGWYTYQVDSEHSEDMRLTMYIRDAEAPIHINPSIYQERKLEE